MFKAYLTKGIQKGIYNYTICKRDAGILEHFVVLVEAIQGWHHFKIPQITWHRFTHHGLPNYPHITSLWAFNYANVIFHVIFAYMIKRRIEQQIIAALQISPTVALLGPRCGIAAIRLSWSWKPSRSPEGQRHCSSFPTKESPAWFQISPPSPPR